MLCTYEIWVVLVIGTSKSCGVAHFSADYTPSGTRDPLNEYFFKRMAQWGKEYGDKNFEATGSPAWGTAAEASFNLFASSSEL